MEIEPFTLVYLLHTALISGGIEQHCQLTACTARRIRIFEAGLKEQT